MVVQYFSYPGSLIPPSNFDVNHNNIVFIDRRDHQCRQSPNMLCGGVIKLLRIWIISWLTNSGIYQEVLCNTHFFIFRHLAASSGAWRRLLTHGHLLNLGLMPAPGVSQASLVQSGSARSCYPTSHHTLRAVSANKCRAYSPYVRTFPIVEPI